MQKSFQVLIVENDPKVVERISSALTGRYASLRLDIAKDGEKALEMLKREEYNLIILAILLPKVDGISVCRELAKDPTRRTTPVVLADALPLYSAAFQRSLKKYKELSVVRAVLQKPFTVDEFMKRMEPLLESRAPSRAAVSSGYPSQKVESRK